MQVTSAQLFKALVALLIPLMIGLEVQINSPSIELAIRPEGQGPVLKVPQEYQTIQAAVDAAPPQATIEVAPGIYSENLLLYKSVWLRGAGAEQTVIKAAREGLPTILIVPPGASISGFTITGAQRAYGVQIYGEAVASIFRSVVAGNSRGGIRVLGHGSTTVRDSIIRDNDLYGIVLEYVGVREMTGFATSWIERNQISGHKEFGVFIMDAYDIFITGNILRDNERGGIWLTNAYRIWILRNDVNGSSRGAAISGDGVSFVSSDYEVIIAGNSLQNNQAGVSMLNIALVKLYRNRIVENQQEGISVLGFAIEAQLEVELEENTVLDNGIYGVLVQSLSVVKRCSKNVVSGNKGGDYMIYGSPPQPSPELKQKCEGD